MFLRRARPTVGLIANAMPDKKSFIDGDCLDFKDTKNQFLKAKAPRNK